MKLNKAIIVEGIYAQQIRNELLRKPSDKAIERNKRCSELVRKLRR